MWVKRVSKRYVILHGCISIVVVLLPLQATAIGFYLPHQSAKGIGRAQAGNVVIANDPSTIFFNPAGMTYLENDELEINATVIFPQATVNNTGTTAVTPFTGGASVSVSGGNANNPTPVSPLASAYANFRLPNKKISIGIGLAMPAGLRTVYNPTWFGRYDSVKSSLGTLNIGPAVSYGEKYWSIGLGLDVQLASAELSNALPNPLVPGGPTAATDGLFKLEGDDVSFGFNVGAMFTFPDYPNTRFGIHYRSAVKHTLEGSATTSGLTGPLASSNGTKSGTVDFDIPENLTIGIAHKTGPWTFLAQGAWFGFGRINEITVEYDDGSPSPPPRVLNFQDAYSVSIGAEYAFNESSGRKKPGPGLTLRGGISYESAIVTDQYRTTSLPDSADYWLSLGASYGVEDDISLDFAIARVILEDATVDSTRQYYSGTGLDSSVTTRAVSEASSTVLTLGFRWEF